ncbi:hypothetical protein BGW80DRAFT_1285757 [Lactifluus volemus]|nr:hypothetical protein BGW80DRAFT_1285757 [Lactifluus volemus]
MPSAMPESHQIFKATYSGIPVYELHAPPLRFVAQRNADSQVAGFDKPQRTRVLEREIQKGEHEKVQGGYGKYQAAKSPPLAPKHMVAPMAGRPPRRTGTDGSISNVRTRKAGDGGDESDAVDVTMRGSEDGSMTPSPSGASSSSRTPSPILSSPEPDTHTHRSANHGPAPPSSDSRKRRAPRRTQSSVRGNDSDVDPPPGANGIVDDRSYGDQILEYFISDSNQIPPILVNPPPDLDPNMAIDDEDTLRCIGHYLLSAGADVFKVNKSGQTALMRSVMFANNYDVRKFPELYEVLHRSTLNIDNYNRTVFHHIVDVAMSKGKTHAARYYMETVLTRLSDYPRELADIINFQDEDLETALTMAARCRSKRLVKLLIDHGADPKLANRDGKSTEDYILEDERFRSSPVMPSRALAMSFRNAQAAYSPAQVPASMSYTFAPANGDRMPLHHSAAAQMASTRAITDMASMLDSLAASFDQELRDKERDLNQAHALLSNIQAEILESQRSVLQLKVQCQGLDDGRATLQGMETELNAKMGKRYRLGWEKWVKNEEERERAVRDAAGGELSAAPPLPSLPLNAVEEPTPTPEGELASGGTKRKADAVEEEDVSDLMALHADVPTEPEPLRAACEALREGIVQHRKRRKEMFDEFVRFQAEAGTGGRMTEYRRLIAAGCGGIPISEVDGVVSMLLESLESEEPSSSSVAWSSTTQASRPVPVG